MGDFLNSSIFSIILKFDAISGDGGYLGGVIPGGMTRDGHDLPSVISIAGRELVESPDGKEMQIRCGRCEGNKGPTCAAGPGLGIMK